MAAGWEHLGEVALKYERFAVGVDNRAPLTGS